MADTNGISNFVRLQAYALNALRGELSSLPPGPGLVEISPLFQNLQNIIQTIENISEFEHQNIRYSPGLNHGHVSATCMSNRKILLNIWKHTTDADLLNFRRINRQWYRLATMVLLKRGALHIRLYYSEKSGSFLVNSPESDLHLEMLNDCLKLSLRFPAAEVRIQGGKLNEPDLLSFLALSGLKIRSLVLRQPETAVNLPELFSLIPNVEKLKLTDFGPSNQLCSYMENSETFDFFPPDLKLLALPSLKYLILEQLDKVPGSFELLLAIAGSTKHLLSISLSQMKFLFCFSDYAHLVKQITFDSHHDIQLCSSFAKLEPKLMAFTIDLSEFRNKAKSICQAAPHLESILVSSKDSLEELTFTRAGLLPAHFPVFSRLKNLNIFDDGNEIRERILPEVISYLPLFPFLQTVVIGVELHHQELRIIFPEDDFRNNCVESFPTVKNLIFLNQSEGECISEMLFLKFPNVANVKIGPGNLSKSDHMLWVMPNTVETLQLSNDSFEILDNGKFISLDSLLTGIPVIKCVGLENMSGIVGAEADSFRSEPWVGALKNLKHLKISFTGNLVLTTKLLTLVSFLYGFNQMPNLKITFAYDFNVKEAESFRILYGPMLPYVNVEHERNDMGLF